MNISCPKCKNILPDDSEFCQYCGAKIDRAALAAVLTCPSCGKELPEDSDFCQYCGAQIDRAVVEEPIALYCYRCGKKLPQDSEFCQYCGETIPNTAPKKKLKLKKKDKKNTLSAKQKEIHKEKSSKPKNLKKILVISIAALALIAAAVIAFFILHDKYPNLNNAKVGDTVIFGAYEQDNDFSNGQENIEWLVLAKEDNKLLLLSKYALDCQPYNSSSVLINSNSVTWESCSLRKWLNASFITSAFTNKEQTYITNTVVQGKDIISKNYNDSWGGDTVDRVFLLNNTEVEKYLSSYSERSCHPTDYAKARGAIVNSVPPNRDNCGWWLRTTMISYHDPDDDYYALLGLEPCSYIHFYNSSSNRTTAADALNNTITVRPAMWIAISK